MAKRVLALAAPIALIGCSPSQPDLPTEPPTSITKVATGGFSSPTDAVASPDGKTFYFAAYDDQQSPAIFRVASEPGSAAEVIAAGDPLAHPTGLVLSCDGATLYVADLAAAQGDDEAAVERGAIHALPVAGGAVSTLSTSVMRPVGLAMAPDCKTLGVTGRTDDNLAALFSLSIDGGSASVIASGEPLVSLTGLHIDTDGVHWVMDHRAIGTAGEGILWAIPADGSAITEVASGLDMGTPGGVSLTAGGGTAVMPTRDAEGIAQLTTVNIATGETIQVAAPDMVDPAGLRTARAAGVFVVVDSEAGAIFRAE
jgi:DNA-binding beta-propeller fold protein YncE